MERAVTDAEFAADREAFTKIRRDIAAVWWDRVPQALQANLLRRAGLAPEFTMSASSSHERWKIATAAESLIHQIEPATKVKV